MLGLDFVQRLFTNNHTLAIPPSSPNTPINTWSQQRQPPVIDDYDGQLDEIRRTEYPQLTTNSTQQQQQQPTVFLDHTGSTLYAASHIRAHAEDMLTHIPANPHSQHAASQWTRARIDHARDRLLSFLGTSSRDYAVIFTANATAAIKLAGELTPLTSSSNEGVFCYTQASHTSVVGLRHMAANQKISVRPAAFEEIDSIIQPENTKGTSFLAYPAQCNFSGERFPLDVSEKIARLYQTDLDSQQHPPWWVLLDAAAYASSSPLNLGKLAYGPDFVALSMYKIFGAPTGLGVLLIKRSSVPFLASKRYFGGGTVASLSFDKQWQEFRGDVEARLEDGTVNYLDVISLHHALDAHAKNYGSMDRVARHTQSIKRYALAEISQLEHPNHTPMCEIYGHDTDDTNSSDYGPVIALNLKDREGKYIGYTEVERLAVMAGLALRSGRFCNPGAAQRWLNLSTPELIHYASLGLVCGDDNDLVVGKPVGALRISFGAMTNKKDIDTFVAFILHQFCDYVRPLTKEERSLEAITTQSIDSSSSSTIRANTPLPAEIELEVDKVVIYPVKSCHGWVVPQGTSWDITQYGFRFDRSFVIMRENNAVPMQQKQYPKMALIRPQVDVDRSMLILSAPGHRSLEISLVADYLRLETSESRVCGDQMQTYRISDDEISDWLSSVLSISCYLACEPRLLLMADDKVMVPPVHVNTNGGWRINKHSGMSFANEGHVLMVTIESTNQVIDWVSDELDDGSGTSNLKLLEDLKTLGPFQYRPNLVVKSAVSKAPIEPFAELDWEDIYVGNTHLQVSGHCKRCKMISIDQESAKTLKEPYSTLARKKRVDGKVVFGVYLNTVDFALQRHLLGDDYLAPTITPGETIKAYL